MENRVEFQYMRGREPTTAGYSQTRPHTPTSHGAEASEHTQSGVPFLGPLKAEEDCRPKFPTLTIPQSFPTLPPRPEFTPFTIPYLSSGEPYDGQDFWTYPERRGWLVHVKDEQCHTHCPPGLCRGGVYPYFGGADRSENVRPPMLSHTDGTPVTASSKAAFLQAWLFFGTLTEVSKMCGLAIDIPAEFIVEDGRAVSTAAINGLSGRWFSALSREQVGNKAFMEDILGIIRHAALLITEESSEPGDDTDIRGEPMFMYTPGEARSFHAIDILLRTLGLHLVLHLYSPNFTASKDEGWAEERITASIDWVFRGVEGVDKLSDEVSEGMAEHGWCWSELYLMSPEELLFASLLDRPRARDHANCGDVLCSAYQTDEATYRTVHVDMDCDCEFVYVPTDELVGYLSKEKVPSVIVTDDLKIRVVCSDNQPYIALSHVWADGLGNPTGNALPQCQLRRLRDYVDELDRLRGSAAQTLGPAAFWMDTLCIPVHPEAKAYRKKAIQLLGKTFHEASAALVLDRELEIVDAATASFLELGIRILCSGWVKRLWTLQEAVLASEAHGEEKIYFQMHDGPFLYQKYNREKKAAYALDGRTTEVQAEERMLLYEDGILILLGEQIPSVRAMRKMREGWSPFRVIYNAVEHRTTSKAEDVPVCIASLVGKDVISILAAPDTQHRLAAFYLLMREIPDGVLWLERVDKLGIKPFRWAPVSLTVCPATAFMVKEEAVCDERGLHVCRRGFILDVTHACEHHTTLPARFRLVAKSGEAGAPYGILWPSLRQATVVLEPGKKLAIVVRPEPVAREPNAVVLLIEEDTDAGSEIEGTVIAYMFFEETPLGMEGLRDGDNVIRCSVTAVEQRWCIT